MISEQRDPFEGQTRPMYSARFRRAWRLHACAISLVLGVAGHGASVHAQSSPSTRASADAPSYRELVDQALSEFRHKNWPEARVSFSRAHELQPNARTLRGLGVVSFEMREYVAALSFLQAALEDTRQPLTDAQRAEATSLVARSRGYVGMFTLQLSPTDTHVLVDGVEPTRDTDGALLLAFGEHTLTASAPGYQDETRKLSVQGAERTVLELSLLPIPEPVVAPPPPVPVVVEPVVALPPPAPVRVDAAEPTRTGGLKYTWVALGAGAVFGGLAVGAWYLGDHELTRLDKRCRERADGDDPCQRGNIRTSALTRYERITDAGIGLAAAAVVTGAVLMVVEWPRTSRVGVAVSPQSISLRGAF